MAPPSKFDTTSVIRRIRDRWKTKKEAHPDIDWLKANETEEVVASLVRTIGDVDFADAIGVDKAVINTLAPGQKRKRMIMNEKFEDEFDEDELDEDEFDEEPAPDLPNPVKLIHIAPGTSQLERKFRYLIKPGSEVVKTSEWKSQDLVDGEVPIGT